MVLEDAPKGIKVAKTAGMRVVATIFYRTEDCSGLADKSVGLLAEISVGKT